MQFSYGSPDSSVGCQTKGSLSVSTIVSVKNLTKTFASGFEALKGVDLDIREGEILALLGPNGAGKSSMLNVINGFYHPQEGEVWFRGEKRPSMKPYEIAEQGIARTFQNIALFHGMTTVENVMTGRQLMMKKNFFWQMLRVGPALDEEVKHRRKCEEIIDFLEHGNIRNSVNFPAVSLERTQGHRIAMVNKNVPRILGSVLSILADKNINVIDMLNKSRDDVAYNLIDVETRPSPDLIDAIRAIEGVVNVRTFNESSV